MIRKKIERRIGLKRYTPVRKKRPTLRHGEPTKEEKAAVRLEVYERAGGRCELNLGPKCIKGVLPFTGSTPWDHGHFVHIRSKSAGGKFTVENGKWGCYECHLGYAHTTGIKITAED